MSHRAAARLAWLLCAVGLLSLAASLLLIFLGLSTALPAGWTPRWEQVISAVGVIGAPILGGLIASRRPENPYGWVWLGFGVGFSLLQLREPYAAYALVVEPGSLPAPRTVVGVLGMAWIVAIVLLPFLLLLFPTGRLPSRRWRFVAWAVVTAGAVAMILGPFRPGETGFAPSQNPFGVGGSAGEAIISVIDAISWFILFAVVPSALSLVLRYRRASGVERQQIKWFAFAATLVGATIVADMLSVDELLDEALWDLLDAVSLTALYAAVGVAILRHRLYDIDVVVNRTPVYGSLTAALVLIYVASVVSLQYVFRVLTGSESQLAVVVSTLAIAALFGPLRSRIQAFIDRRFYRRKYDAARTLEAFSVRLRDETDLDRLGDELVECGPRFNRSTSLCGCVRRERSEKRKGSAKCEKIPREEFRNAFRNAMETVGT